MSDNEGSNRLEGIGDALKDEDTATEESTTDVETAATEKRDQRPGTESEADSVQPGPAFPFDATAQTPIYPRQETTNEDLPDFIDFDLKVELRDHGIRDLTKREAHEAIVRVAIENPDLVVDRILQERGIDR